MENETTDPVNQPMRDVMSKLSQRSSEAAKTSDERIAELEQRRKAAAIGSLWVDAAVPLRHAQFVKAMTPDDMERKNPWTKSLVKLTEKLGTGFLVGLVGLRGTGKTQIGACLILAACRKEQSARYVTAMDFFREIREAFRDKGYTEREIVSRYVGYSLLVIDEAHERGNTEFENRTLTNIIDHRYGRMRDTVLISNETAEQFAVSVGPSIMSRLNETGKTIDCDWPSFRK